ncbi:GIN domain-containing protein [Ralstonia mannitolilytica]|uniref:GIN domain-containing protein n=1 Tax=Ralstonia mannitolilytica TaxID=105219 RepID=UPI0037485FA7
MDLFDLPDEAGRRVSAWEHTETYIKEARPLSATHKIVVKGSIDVLFRRSDKPTMVIAGETAEAVALVKTYIDGSKLVIEREGVTISFGSSSVRVAGTVGQIVHGDWNGPLHIDMRGKGITITGVPRDAINHGKVVVGIAMPEAPAIKIKGSGDMTLVDLQQASLDLEIEGSGAITAYGQVDRLDVQISGSGDVDASELSADRASLSVTGSGDIVALVSSDAHARVVGSGDIVVFGNPSQRNHSVTGSGKIKFK